MIINANTEFSIDQAVLDLNAPITNPTCTRAVSVNGTLTCPQRSPHITQNDFNIIKTPGRYNYEGATISNAPSSSQNVRSIEIGYNGRYSQIAMPWDADQMFFRSQINHGHGSYLTP